jgi:hypothetical protein
MALMEMGVRALSTRLPKVISPKNHAIIDYATAGSFFLMVPFLWRRNKRAAIVSLVCGGVETATSLMTDYPGGVTKVISFSTHGRLDSGLAGVFASLPSLMGFADQWQAWFFRTQGMSVAAVAAMTDFEVAPARIRRRRYAA